MMLLRNSNNRVPDFNSFKTCPGDKFHVEYSSRIRPDGTYELTESSRTDIQKEINSFAEQTDIRLIIAKLQMGDTSGLTSKKALFGDFTQLPSSYAEMLSLVQRSEKAFDGLDPEIKEKFDNDRNKWFASIGSTEWMESMGFISVEPDANESEVD